MSPNHHMLLLKTSENSKKKLSYVSRCVLGYLVHEEESKEILLMQNIYI